LSVCLFLSVCLSLSLCLSVCLSLFVFLSLLFYLSVSLSLFVCLSLSLFCMSLSPSVSLSLSLSVSLSVCLSVCLSVQSPGGPASQIFAKLEVYLWLGLAKYSKEVTNSLPDEFKPVYEEDEKEQKRLCSAGKRELPVTLSCQGESSVFRTSSLLSE